MNRVFNSKYHFYLIFSILLWPILIIFDLILLSLNIYKPHEHFILLTLISALLMLFIYLALSKSKNRTPDSAIIFILIWAIILALAIQIFNKMNSSAKNYLKKFSNPLYSNFMEIGKKYHLDLSFTKQVWEQRGPIDFKKNTIYSKAKKSLDIIFFGDSLIAWGLIPSVIEQLTGKKIAIFAYENNFLNQETVKIFNQISSYYLKKKWHYNSSILSLDHGKKSYSSTQTKKISS